MPLRSAHSLNEIPARHLDQDVNPYAAKLIKAKAVENSPVFFGPSLKNLETVVTKAQTSHKKSRFILGDRLP